jgi:cytochrome c-type biogenesis protein
MGLTMSAIGSVVYEAALLAGKNGGVIVVVFGLHMTSIIRIPFLEYDLRPQSKMDRQRGFCHHLFWVLHFLPGGLPAWGQF